MARTERRQVRVHDRHLSDAANAELTDELREAVGAEEVEVPVDTPRREFDVAVPRSRAAATLVGNRLLIGITFVAAIVVGAIVALASDHWWLLLVPVGVHALGTMAIGFTVIQMTTQPEALDPTVRTRLQDEGVAEPDKAFNDLVEEFQGRTDAAGTSEVVVTGGQHRERSAMTASADGSEPAPDRSPVLGVQLVIVPALAVASIVGAIVFGGLAWVAPGVLLPFVGAWAAYYVLARRGDDHEAEHPAGDSSHQRHRATLMTIGVVVAVELIAIVAAIIGSTM